MTWNIGDILLGKYRVERLIGQGGMGVVLAARHVELNELYAIKMMHTRLPSSDDSAGRFLREARASARLKGDHVARVHDVGRTDDGDLYMVMEHLEGLDLKSYLGQKGQLVIEEAIDYILQACEGIGEAHEAGIIHRDIKPANLFLVRKRKSGQPQIKVLDFGISKEIHPGSGTELTQSGTLLGSPLYMSPEQMQYANQVDARTDVWSLGVVLYELITGKVPFPGETMTQVIHSVMHLEPKPLHHYRPDVPPSLDAVMAQCLKKDANQRIKSIEHLIEALRAVTQNSPGGQLQSAITIQEKPTIPVADASLEATAAAMAFEPTVATPAQMATPLAPTLGLTKTEVAIQSQPIVVPSPAVQLSKTLESASLSAEPASQESPVAPATPKSRKLALFAGVAALSIGTYCALRIAVFDEKPAVTTNSSTSASEIAPISSSALAPSAASANMSPQSYPSASASNVSPSVSPEPPSAPKSLSKSALPQVSTMPPLPPAPPMPPPPPASPSAPRWNGPL